MQQNDWWVAGKNQAHDQVLATVKSIDTEQSTLRSRFLDFMRVYGVSNIGGSNLGVFSARRLEDTVDISWNAVKSAIDTLVSKISKFKPRPKVIPSGAEWETRNKAADLTKYLDGQFQFLKAYSLGKEVIRDACIFGTGIVKVFHINSKPQIERVFPLEIYVSDIDGLYKKPRCLYQVKPINKYKLAGLYPEKRNKILDAPASALWNQLSTRKINDLTDVTEAWKLPEGDKPGRHIIAINDTTLVDEDYTEDDFPFVFLRWLERPIGFWGQGIVEELLGNQSMLNEITDRITESVRLYGNAITWVPTGADIMVDEIDNDIGTIIESSRPPEVIHNQPYSQELLGLAEALYAKEYELVGVSQLSAQSRKPEGLNSGKAIREFNDIESERFYEFTSNVEEMYLSLAEHLIALGRDIYENEGDHNITFTEKDLMQTIKWSEVDLEKDKYFMSLFPTSLLPTKPEGKLATVEEMLQAGIIEQEVALEMLDIPDVEQYTNVNKSARDFMRKGIERIANKGIWLQIEPFHDLNFAYSYAIAIYNKMQLEDLVPEEHMELLRRFIDTVKDMQDQAQAAMEPPPEAPAPQGPPQGPLPQ